MIYPGVLRRVGLPSTAPEPVMAYLAPAEPDLTPFWQDSRTTLTVPLATSRNHASTEVATAAAAQFVCASDTLPSVPLLGLRCPGAPPKHTDQTPEDCSLL